MPRDSEDTAEAPHTPAGSDRSDAGIEKEAAAGESDEPVPNQPPRSLMGRRLKLYAWLLIALLLGAVIAFFLVGLSD